MQNISRSQKSLLYFLSTKTTFVSIKDFHTITVASAIYRGLIRYDSTGEKAKLTAYGKECHRRIVMKDYNCWLNTLRSVANDRNRKKKHEKSSSRLHRK